MNKWLHVQLVQKVLRPSMSKCCNLILPKNLDKVVIDKKSGQGLSELHFHPGVFCQGFVTFSARIEENVNVEAGAFTFTFYPLVHDRSNGAFTEVERKYILFVFVL